MQDILSSGALFLCESLYDMTPFRQQALDPRFHELDAKIQAGLGDEPPVKPAPPIKVKPRPALVRRIREKKPPHLTPREQELFVHVVSGRNPSEIALAMRLTPGAAKVYVSHLLRKLRCRDRIELVVRAYRGELPQIEGVPEVRR